MGLILYLPQDFEKSFRFDRLQDKGIGTQIQGQLSVTFFGVGGGVDDERDMREAGVGLPLLEQRVAVHDGHQQIRNNHVGRGVARLLQCFVALAGSIDLITVADEQRLQVIEVFFPVIDDEDSRHQLLSISGDCQQTLSTSSTKVSGSMGFSI